MTDQNSKSICVQSPAKVNLFLEVVGKRADGYHELETVFQEIDLYDEILVCPIEDGRIKVSSDSTDVPQDRHNLAYQAAVLFFEETGIKRGVHIHITKKIPIAAGLGGGSSNAATTLKALQKLFERELSSRAAFNITRRLGADVPFFLKGGLAKGTGRGDELEPLSRRGDFFLVLINPGFRASTAEIYHQLKLNYERNSKINDVVRALEEGDNVRLGASLFNRLEDVVLVQSPRLCTIKQTLQKLGALGVLLSGSGPTLYAIVNNVEEGRRIKNGLADLKCWTVLCQAV